MSDWFAMKTKFVGKCKICNKLFEVGDDILWKRGEGVKCPTTCKAESVYDYDNTIVPVNPVVTPEEWVDFNKYNRQQLSKVKNCQKCGTSLDGKDIFNNNNRRTCENCFLI